MNSNKFKRWGPKDFEKISAQEKKEEYQQLLTTVTTSKQEHAARLQSRRVEREIVRGIKFV